MQSGGASFVINEMALLDDDDVLEEAKGGGLRAPGGQDEAVQMLHDASDSFDSHRLQTRTAQYTAPAPSCSSNDKVRRKKEKNERRKMMRRAGVYSDPNRSRNERKNEIAFLRERLQKLQLELKALQSRPGEHSQKQEAVAGGSGDEMALIPRVWQEIATHQRRRREESESENIRLRLVVEQQQKLADSLSSLLRKRATHLVRCKPASVVFFSFATG